MLQLQMEKYVQEIMRETKEMVKYLHGLRGKSFPKQNNIRPSVSFKLKDKGSNLLSWVIYLANHDSLQFTKLIKR